MPIYIWLRIIQIIKQVVYKMDNKTKRLTKQKEETKLAKTIKDLCYEFVGAFLFAVGIYTFARAAQYATSGVSGVALIVNHVLPAIPVGTLTFIINIPIILLCYKIVGRKFMLRSLRTMLIVVFFTDVVVPLIPEYTGNKILACIFAGVFAGLGLATVYMRGTSTGGTDFIVMSIKKLHPHMSIGQLILLTDCIVILLGGVVFGNIDAVLYGIITSFVSTTVIDKMIFGAGGGKLTIIISKKGKEIAQKINSVADRGVTRVNAVGTYSGSEMDMLFCVASKSQVFKIRNIAHEIDENAFITITEASEIFGEGFTPHI